MSLSDRIKTACALACVVTATWSSGATAQVSSENHRLTLHVAMAAAIEAINVCKAKGYDVTATVVDVEGTPKVVLRGDYATVHTKDSSFRKAYTVVTMGPIFHVDTTSDWLAIVAKYPPLAGQALANTPNVAALPGGAAIKIGDRIIGGLGVGGAPGGEKDEVCAKAGAAKAGELL